MATKAKTDHAASVRLPIELHKNLKRVCKKTGLTLGALIKLTLLEAYPCKEAT